jgi:hypothetical protein
MATTMKVKPLNIKRCCATCANYHPTRFAEKSGVGECHFNAPDIKGLNEVGEFSSFGVWPTVAADNHCGRWALGAISVTWEDAA